MTDYNGANVTPANGSTLETEYVNVGTFTITAGYTVHTPQGQICKVYADTANILGTIEGQGRGYSGGQVSSPGAGPGASPGSNINGSGTGGAGHAGAGGASGDGSLGGIAYGSPSDTIVQLGSGSGGDTYRAGSNGGGALFINANDVTISGTIDMGGDNGTGPTTATGGGSGGGLCIICDTLICTSSSMNCNGGNGQWSTYDSSGGGSGGRAKFFYNSTDVDPLTVCTVTAGLGGTGSGDDGQPGSIGTETGYPNIITSDSSNNFGQTINFGITGTVTLTAIGLYVDSEITSNVHTLHVWDSPEKLILYGAEDQYVFLVGAEVIFEFVHPVKLPDGQKEYYFEVSTADFASHEFAFACNDKYVNGNAYNNGIELDGVDLWMRVYTIAQVTNPKVYNIADKTVKCNVGSTLLTGAVQQINNDGTGAYQYDDDHTNDKWIGDSADHHNATRVFGDIDFTAGGYLYYKISTMYPITGIPILDSHLYIATGTPMIQIAQDVDGLPGTWYNIDTAVVSDVLTEYPLDCEDLHLENKNVFYFRFDFASATGSLYSMAVDCDINTTSAQIPTVNPGAANTFRCDQNNTSSIDCVATLTYMDAKI